MSQQKKRPVAEAVRRRNILGALWQNHDGNGSPFYVSSVTRFYQDRNEKWQNDTLHVPLDDIPKVIAILQEMEREAYQRMQADYEAKQGAA